MAQLFCAWNEALTEQTHNHVLLSDIVDLDYPEFDALFDKLLADGSATIEHEGRTLFIKAVAFNRCAPRYTGFGAL